MHPGAADPDRTATLCRANVGDDTPNAAASSAAPSAGIATPSGLRYRILRLHARGGLGEVFVARDEELRREVALKEIQSRHAGDPACQARFMQEAEITGRLEHPGIVPVYGLGTHGDGRPFYAMCFIEGDSLMQAIAHYHRLAPDTSRRAESARNLELRKLLRSFIDVCNAIAYAHSRGILHRDLKPGNIMLGKYGETLVVDWGLAKALAVPPPGTSSQPGDADRSGAAADETPPVPASGSRGAETVAGTAIGTPAYMSPEQAAGQLDRLGPASDVYSLGATLYCMVTGKPPFAGSDVREILNHVQRGEFQRPAQANPTVPPPLEAVCLKAMAREPEQRYPSPCALADDIEHWLADEPVGAWREPLTARASRWMRRHRPLVSGAAAAMLVGLAALTGGTFWYQARQSEVVRQLALTAHAVQQSVDQSQEGHDRLRADLMKPGGVQELLNQPARWEMELKLARGAWLRAQALAANAGEALGAELTDCIDGLDRELTAAEADFQMAMHLEKIHLDSAALVSGRFDYVKEQQGYAQAFADAGLASETGRPEELARRVQRSPIRDHLLAALDTWAWLAHITDRPQPCRHLLEVARQADPDPWRSRLRDPEVWADGAAVQRLTDELRQDRQALARQSPQLLHTVAALLPPQRRSAWLRVALAAHPQDFWLNFALAASLQDIKEHVQEAVGFYRVALAIRPNTAAVYNNLAHVLIGLNDLAAAEDACTKALALAPDYARAWNNLGNVRSRQQDDVGAVEAYRKAIALDPKVHEAWGNLGIVLTRRRELPAAIEAFKRALTIEARDANVCLNLGKAHYEMGAMAAAVEANHKALAIRPQFVQAWHNLGMALEGQNDPIGAQRAFEKAVAIDPRYTSGWTNLGALLHRQRQFSAAIDAYQKALAINPHCAGAWHHLVGTLAAQGDLPAAIAAYRKAIELDGKVAMTWYNFGNILRDHKDVPAAIDAFQKALALDPRYVKAWNNLGNLYARNDLPRAIDAHRKAVAIDDRFADGWRNLGNELGRSKDGPGAAAAYEKVLALDPKDITALNNLAWFRATASDARYRDGDAAIALAKRAIALKDEPLFWGTLAAAYAEFGDFSEAVRCQKRALQDPTYLRSHGDGARERLKLYRSSKPYRAP